MGLNAGNLVLLVEFLFRLAGELGGGMPIPLTTPGHPAHRPCGVHCATQKITVAAELANEITISFAQTVLALTRYFLPLLVDARGLGCQLHHPRKKSLVRSAMVIFVGEA